MIATGGNQRYSIRSWLEWKPPWWLLFAWFAWLWISLILAAIVRGYEPPAGWVGAIAGTPVVALLFGFVFWVARINADQHLVVRPDGLLVAIPFPKLIRFDEIEQVNRVTHSEPFSEFGLINGLMNIINRRLVPARDQPPNVDINLRKAVRLNLYPFRWFRQLQLTLDRPAAFLAALPSDVMVHSELGGEDPPATTEQYGFRERVILVGVLVFLAAATVYWIAFDG